MKITREEHFQRREIEKKGFMQGYAVAVSIVAKIYGYAEAYKVIQEGNFNLKSFYKCGIDPADLAIIREAARRNKPL